MAETGTVSTTSNEAGMDTGQIIAAAASGAAGALSLAKLWRVLKRRRSPESAPLVNGERDAVLKRIDALERAAANRDRAAALRYSHIETALQQIRDRLSDLESAKSAGAE